MYADTRIRSALEAMFAQIEVPPVPLAAINRRMLQARTLPTVSNARPLRFAIAVAAAVAIVASLPILAPGLVQSVDARIAQILNWTPPPVRPPRQLLSSLRTENATLATAQSIVPFTVVVPAGLPDDVRSSAIETVTTALYVKATRTWQKGTPAIVFTYRRGHGRSFSLLADRFDPRVGPPGRSMFLDTGLVRDGMPVLKGFEKFAWRNGNQVMSAVADGISPTEIAAIRMAMRGVPVAPAQTSAEADSGSISKMYPAGP